MRLFLQNGDEGIELDNSDSNLIKENTTNDNVDDGIFLFSSDSNMIKGNIVNDNGDDGIFLSANSNDNDVFFDRAFGNGNLDIEEELGAR